MHDAMARLRFANSRRTCGHQRSASQQGQTDMPKWEVLGAPPSPAHAEIEVASLELGNQIEAEWLPLIGLVYDHKDNSVEVALEVPFRKRISVPAITITAAT